MKWRIEGTWTGYTSAQRRVVHRTYTGSRKFANQVRAIGAYRFGDGTSLILTVTVQRGTAPEVINGYSSLIESCVRYGVNNERDLQEAEK